MLNVECSSADYDICFEPAKTLVEFRDWDRVLALLKIMVNDFLRKYDLLTTPDEATSGHPPIDAAMALQGETVVAVAADVTSAMSGLPVPANGAGGRSAVHVGKPRRHGQPSAAAVDLFAYSAPTQRGIQRSKVVVSAAASSTAPSLVSSIAGAPAATHQTAGTPTASAASAAATASAASPMTTVATVIPRSGGVPSATPMSRTSTAPAIAAVAFATPSATPSPRRGSPSSATMPVSLVRRSRITRPSPRPLQQQQQYQQHQQYTKASACAAATGEVDADDIAGGAPPIGDVIAIPSAADNAVQQPPLSAVAARMSEPATSSAALAPADMPDESSVQLSEAQRRAISANRAAALSRRRQRSIRSDDSADPAMAQRAPMVTDGCGSNSAGGSGQSDDRKRRRLSPPVPCLASANMAGSSLASDGVPSPEELGDNSEAVAMVTSMEEDDASVGEDAVVPLVAARAAATSQPSPPSSAMSVSASMSAFPDIDVPVSQVMPGFDASMVMPARTSKLTGQATATIRPMVFSKDMFHRIKFIAQCDNKVPSPNPTPSTHAHIFSPRPPTPKPRPPNV